MIKNQKISLGWVRWLLCPIWTYKRQSVNALPPVACTGYFTRHKKVYV